jgi:hypothetical protein
MFLGFLDCWARCMAGLSGWLTGLLGLLAGWSLACCLASMLPGWLAVSAAWLAGLMARLAL